MTELRRRGHDVAVITGRATPRPWASVHETDGVHLLRVEDPDFASAFDDALRHYAPHVVLTQLMWSEYVLHRSGETGVPTVLFLRSADGALDLSCGSPHAPTQIVANSSFVARFALERWGRAAAVVPPLIRIPPEAASRDPGDNGDITMFNPTRDKGGHVLRAVAERLSDRRFLVVEGWHNWKTSDGRWDLARLAQAARGYGAAEIKVPELTEFDDLENVEVLPARPDVAAIYDQTRVLLVPSLWPEPYGRVIVEGMAHGIPVLHSGLGGMKEAADDAGIVVRPPASVAAWVEAILDLDDNERYADHVRRSLARASRYDLDREVERAETIISTAAGAGGALG